MKLYYIEGCCKNYISDEPVDFRCETCGDDHRTEFEIDTDNIDWIKKAIDKGYYIDVDFFKHIFEELKHFKIPENESESLKRKVLIYIKEKYLDI